MNENEVRVNVKNEFLKEEQIEEIYAMVNKLISIGYTDMAVMNSLARLYTVGGTSEGNVFIISIL